MNGRLCQLLRARRSRPPTALAYGQRSGDEWQVAVRIGGSQALLPVDQARRLAGQIAATCDVLDGLHPALEGWRR